MKAADRKHGTKSASAAHNGARGAREVASAPPSAPAKPSSEDRYKRIALRSSASCLHNSALSGIAAKCRIRKVALRVWDYRMPQMRETNGA